MAKLVILKSFFDAYYDNMVEKSTTHKYIRKVPKSSGKGYNYFYPKDFAKPFKALLSFFGMKEDKVDKAYTDNNIQQAYGVSKQGFAQHVLEYLTNRKTWNKFFESKANRDKYKVPEKSGVKEKETIEVKEKVIEGGKTKEKITEKVTETKEKNFKSTWNRSLMRKIYSMYNSVPEDKIESKPGSDSIAIGDSVSYNGKVGTIGSKFKGGIFGVSFGNGSFARIAAKDLQKMNPTSEEVTESTEINAEKQDVNGTNEAVKETLEDYYAGGVVESTREKLATEKQYTPYDIEFYMNRSESEIKTDLEREKLRKNPNSRLIAALEGALAWHQIPDEAVKEEIKETESNNSDKERIKTQFKVEHEDHSLDDLEKLKIDIQDNIKMSADDEYSQPEDIDRLKAQLEAVEEMITERDTSALSQAMMGNDNAAGERAKKPQTEKAMKKEEKKLEKARIDAGLPKPQMFERTSTIDDSTWDPNSENYRFRDTGYIAGARKEQATLYITRSAKEGVRVNAKEVDWNGIEENPRTAEKLIVKSNVFGDVDWNGLKEKGMSGSAAFLIDRIYASAGTKPDESSPTACYNYVIALNGLRDRFENCKTVEDVLNTLSEIKDEINGEYVEIKESPKYLEIQNKRKELRSIALAKKAELDGLSEQGRKTHDFEYQKVVEKYIEKGKKEKKLRWNTRVSQYNIPKEYQADFERETKGIWDKAYAPWKQAVADFKEELKARGVKEEEFFEKNRYNSGTSEIGWYNLWELMPEMKEYDRLGDELDKYIEGQKVVISKKNPLLEAWKTLGPKFINLSRSDTFAQHRYDCKKGKYDDWTWAEKDVTVKVKKQSKERKKFDLIVAENIERKGGRQFDITSTADLKKAFNLREVQSGNWVLKDPESAEFHVRNAARAFADLADITGIPDNKISLNGRLAMAFGARGTGNAGGSSALAHYEPEERVINLTKFKDGGCLGHEWFHAFDNLITCAMNGDNASNIMLTNKFSNLTPATKELVLEYLKYKNSNDWSADYQRRKIAKKLEAKNFDVKQLDKPQSELQIKVQNAFDNLVKAMTEGNSHIKSAVVYSAKDYKEMLFNMKDEKIAQMRDYDKIYGRSRPSMQVAIADAGSLDKAVAIINERYATYSDKKSLKNKSDWVRLAAAYYDRQPNGNELGNPLLVDSGKVGSQFLADAFDLDDNGARSKDYWSSTHEMAARAFSAYVEDTLNAMDRKNDYLASYSDNKYYPSDQRPFPEGEERKRINEAFKKLFEVVRENNAIEKAIMISDKPDFIVKGGRFLIRK